MPLRMPRWTMRTTARVVSPAPSRLALVLWGSLGLRGAGSDSREEHACSAWNVARRWRSGHTLCPVCGHAYSDRERSLADLQPTHAAQASLPAGTPAAPAHPSSQNAPAVKYVGECGTTGLPRDLPGRFVLGIALGMAADLLLPWVSVNGQNVTPASIGAPVIVVVALLAAATLPVFTTSLRQHPVWSALPLMVGAFCAGIAGSVWLLLAPLAQIFAVSFGSDPSNLALSPQGGLYLFLLGSAVLAHQRPANARGHARVTIGRRSS